MEAAAPIDADFTEAVPNVDVPISAYPNVVPIVDATPTVVTAETDDQEHPDDITPACSVVDTTIPGPISDEQHAEAQEQILHSATVGQNTLPPTVLNAGRLIMRHHVFQDGQWKSRLAQPHPTVHIALSTTGADYDQFKIKNPPLVSCNTTAVVDSGAQCCVWGWALCKKAGFRRCDLIPVRQKLHGVSKSKLTIYGALLLRLTGTSASGALFSAAAIVYVSPDVSDFYMSQDVMIKLCIVPPNFPSIGGANLSDEAFPETAAIDSCPCLP